MLSSVFEYVKGATMSHCEEAETPAVAVSEPPPSRPPSLRSAGEAPNFFHNVAIFDSPFPPRTRPGPRAGAGAGAGARGCRRDQGKSERDPRLETPPVTASQVTGPLVRSRGGPQMTSHRERGIPKIRRAASLTSPTHLRFRRSRRLPSIPGSPSRTRRNTATPVTTSSTSAFTHRPDHPTAILACSHRQSLGDISL